jgi:hypothetical protein
MFLTNYAHMGSLVMVGTLTWVSLEVYFLTKKTFLRKKLTTTCVLLTREPTNFTSVTYNISHMSLLLLNPEKNPRLLEWVYTITGAGSGGCLPLPA